MTPSGLDGRLIKAAPAGIASLLSLQGLSFPFLWDDFDFLARAQTFDLAQLLPEPSTLYWRPLSRELYFAFLYQFGSLGPFVGHAANLILLVLATYILTDLAMRVAGRTAGLFAGLLFATYPHMPFLVAWPSGGQDLLSIVFILGALRARCLDHNALSALAFALALLSKETALAVTPILASMNWLLGRRPSRLTSGWLLFGSVALGWTLFHPGPRALLHQGLAATQGLHATPHPSLFWGAATVLNIPMQALDTLALESDWLPIVLALVLSALTVASATRNAPPTSQPKEALASGRVAVLAALLCVLPLVLTTTLASIRSPYYGCFPFMGAAIGFGLLLSSLRPGIAMVALLSFIGLGGAARATRIDAGMPTMRNLEYPAAALKAIEREFKSLTPNIDGRATVYVSVQSSGHASVHAHINRFQALRIWYRNPHLATLAPQQFVSNPGRELLFWISPGYHVFGIDLHTLKPSTTGPRPARGEYEKVLRRYAIGRASAGEVPAAVSILTQIDVGDLTMRVYNYRLAAALLIADSREEAAEKLLSGVPAFAWEPTLDFVMTTFGEYLQEVDRDDAVMRAFGIAPDDLRANRSIMLGLDRYGWSAPGLRFARRVLALNPDDGDAKRILDAATRARRDPQITVPVPPRS